MPEDARREVGDADESAETGGGGDRTGDPPRDEARHAVAGDEQDDADSSGNVAGEFRPSKSIEPGSPKLGNALFVIAGAYVTVLGLTRLFVDVGGFDSRDLLVLTGGMLLVSIALLGFLGLLTPDT